MKNKSLIFIHFKKMETVKNLIIEEFDMGFFNLELKHLKTLTIEDVFALVQLTKYATMSVYIDEEAISDFIALDNNNIIVVKAAHNIDEIILLYVMFGDVFGKKIITPDNKQFKLSKKTELEFLEGIRNYELMSKEIMIAIVYFDIFLVEMKTGDDYLKFLYTKKSEDMIEKYTNMKIY